MSQFIDLSVFIEEGSKEPATPKIKRVNHKDGAKLICKNILFMGKKSLVSKVIATLKYAFGKKIVNPDSFPQSEFISNELVTITTHTGTHLDAPWHYGSTCEGEKSKMVSEIPLEYCFGDGVVLDLTSKQPGAFILTEDIQKALKEIGYEIKENDIVLIKTGFDKKWGTPEYFTSHPGMSREATLFLIEKGVKVLGIDAYGFDRPFGRMVSDYARTGDRSVLWPTHFLGREKEYFHMERLANLDKIPKPFGFKVACFPIKVKDVGAGWVRAVAIVD